MFMVVQLCFMVCLKRARQLVSPKSRILSLLKCALNERSLEFMNYQKKIRENSSSIFLRLFSFVIFVIAIIIAFYLKTNNYNIK